MKVWYGGRSSSSSSPSSGGGGVGAYAEKKAWAKYDSSTSSLTFYYGEKESLGDDEYDMNADGEEPMWTKNSISNRLEKVVFDKSFAYYRPTTCYKWFSSFSYLVSIEGIENLNTSNVTDMSFMFSSCYKLVSLDLSKFDTSKVTDMSQMFSSCFELASLDLSKFDTSNVTDMSFMFSSCYELASLDLSKFDTSKVTNMGDMFSRCFGLTSLDLSSFDTSKVTNMGDMFSRCFGLTSLDLSSFDTSNVTNMRNMFYGCSGLTSLNLSSFDTSSVTDMASMFSDCSGLTSLDLLSFDTSSVTDMASMFSDCSGLTSLDLLSFDTSSATSMRYMFYCCSGLTSLVLSNFDTSHVTDMEAMFSGCSGLTSLDLLSFDTSSVTNMSYMFRSCSGLTSLDLSDFNTSNVTSMAYMFMNCSQLRTIYASDGFVLSNVSKSNRMFDGCTNLQGELAYDENYTNKTYAKVDLGYFTAKICPLVKSADGVLTFCVGSKRIFADGEFALNDAESLPVWSADDFDKSGITKVVFDESFADVRPTSCASWFANFTGLQTVEGWEYLNTSEVTNMNSMFLNCKSLRSLDLTTFDTQQVRDMGRMFEGCTKMETLDLMSFDTQKIYYISFMFYGDGKLKTIYASDKFSLSHLADNKYMNFQNIFTDCVSLAGEVRYNPKWDTGRSFAKTEGGYFLDKQYVRPWVGFADGTLTFNYSYKRLLSYQENYVPYTSGQQWKPGWIRDHSTEIKKVVFDKTFAEARLPTVMAGSADART